MASTGLLSVTGAATVNFNGGLNVSGAALTFNAGSTAIFAGASTITPTANITFGNFQISAAVAVTLAGAIKVAGSWTTGAGATVSGAFDVTFSGAAKFIPGATAFPKGIILAHGATYALATTAVTFSASALTFTAGASATTLTHTGTATLNISGTVTINQPTAAVTNNWLINAGTGTAGTLSFVGSNATAGLVGETKLTTGALTATTLSFDLSNTTDANQVLTRSGAGAITITNAFTLVHGTISMTGAGTLNFSAGFTMSGGTFATFAAETINFNTNFTNSTGSLLTLNATCTANFASTTTVTPGAGITLEIFPSLLPFHLL